MHGLGWVALWAIPVFAQSAPEEAEVPPEDAAPAAVERPTALHGSHSWYDAVPPDADTRVYMDLAAAGPLALAVDGGGGIWRTEDAGTRWRLVLPPLAQVSGPGDLSPPVLGTRTTDNSLDYRALELADELSSDMDSSDFYDGVGEDYEADSFGDAEFDDTDASEEDAQDDAPEGPGGDEGLGEALQDQVALDGLLREARDLGLKEGAMRLGGTVWIHPDTPDLALAGRADGLWRSTDSGRTWRQVDPETSATVFAAGPGRLLLVGTGDGLRYSVDEGVTWIDKDENLDGRRVRDLTVSAEGQWWCGTSDGLFTSMDGEFWSELPAEGLRVRDVRSVLVEPGTVASLVLTDNETFYRLSEDGQSVLVVGRQPLLDTTVLLAPGLPGHLFAAGSDGVWESIDGGLSWRPLASGLTDPQIFDLAFVDGVLFSATLNGLMRLDVTRPPVEETPPDPSAPASSPALIPSLRAMLFATTGRVGLDPAYYAMRRIKRPRLVPSLNLYGAYDHSMNRSTTFSNPPTSESVDRDFRVYVNLSWGGGSGSGSDSDVMVVDDMVFVDMADLTDGLPVTGASHQRKMTAYRYAVMDLVTALYQAREQLIEIQENLPPSDLRAQVMHELHIQEVTARLDGYTDGAFTRGTVHSESP